MPQRPDKGTSSSNEHAVTDDGPDALTLTHTPPSSFGAGVPAACEVTLPRSIGNVTVQEEIGRGGMGVVFRGWDGVLHRTVAVKFLPAIASTKDDPQFNQFFGGARAGAAVNHPNIVTVYDAGQIEGVPYLVMEYIDGPSLTVLIQSKRGLPLAVTVKVMWDVAEAVSVLHNRNIIHRDLKTGNILFNREGHLFVTDFGLASLRRRIDDPAAAAGTPAYMAPETFEGKASPQSDVYAMGCILFELLTGRRPFTGDVEAIREQHVNAPLPVDQLPDSIPPSLVEVMGRATHKKAILRFKRAEHFRRALKDSVATEELLREGAVKLETLILAKHRQAPVDSADIKRDEPSTGTYFERLSELASKKRDTPTQSPTRSEDQRDLFCLKCGYNLRGLSGDPRRCPECGHHNRMEHLEIPAELIQRTLRRLETGAALCGAMTATVLFWLLPSLIVMLYGPASSTHIYVWIFVVAGAVVAMAAWIAGMIRFRRSCGGMRGWHFALLRFHFFALAIAASGLAAIIDVCLCIARVFVPVSLPFPVFEVLPSLIFVPSMLLLSVWLYRLARNSIRPLQRQTAAQVARASMPPDEKSAPA